MFNSSKCSIGVIFFFVFIIFLIGAGAPHRFVVAPAAANEINVMALAGLSADGVVALEDAALGDERGAGAIWGPIGAIASLPAAITGILGGMQGNLMGGLLGALGGLPPVNLVAAQINETTIQRFGLDTQSINLTSGGTTVHLCAGSCGATVSVLQQH